MGYCEYEFEYNHINILNHIFNIIFTGILDISIAPEQEGSSIPELYDCIRIHIHNIPLVILFKTIFVNTITTISVKPLCL